MDFHKTEAALQSDYRSRAAQYRNDDEIEVTTRRHRRLAGVLSAISSSFDRPISALDVGCGTGRYFHCLRNVDRLVGMDISAEMLAAAARPVNSHDISARNIELIRGNAFFETFAPGSFDFIYSLGMFGHGCPLTAEICDKFHSWLAPGGKLFFDVIDLAGLPWMRRIKKQARNRFYPMLPPMLKAIFDDRQNHTPFFGLTQSELEEILRASRFSDFTITSQICESPLWQGRHLECHACIPQ